MSLEVPATRLAQGEPSVMTRRWYASDALQAASSVKKRTSPFAEIARMDFSFTRASAWEHARMDSDLLSTARHVSLRENFQSSGSLSAS